jgi:Ca2+-binding EF-hand superfamily protein
MTVEEVQKIIDEVDDNGDGRLDYREVRKIAFNLYTP